jgi:hypothetical protein
MLVFTESANGNPYNVVHYNYDSMDHLMSTTTINYGDTFHDATFKYLGDVLKYSFYAPKWENSDTLFYFFNLNNKLDSTIEHDREGSLLNVTKTEYFYNTAKQVIHSISRLTENSVRYLTDSIFYDYAANNVSTVKQYIKHGSGPWELTTLNILYDNRKNYYNTMGMPATTYPYWSENNILQITFAGSSHALKTMNYTKYNEAGYPAEFTEINDLLQKTVLITYECQ